MKTRPVGIHLSLWQTQWRDDLKPLIGKAQAAGYEVAEFPLLFPRELPVEALRAELDRLGMQASCGTGLDREHDITSPDAQLRAQGLDQLRACLTAAAQLGSPILGGVNYAPWGFFPDDDWQTRRDTCVDSLKEAAKMAEDLGVTLCLEVVNRFEGYLINTVGQGQAIIEEVGSAFIKLHLDSFHLNIEADDISAEIRRAGALLGHFHCVANNRKMPGQGHLDWEPIWSSLDDIGYDGYLVVESFLSPAGEVGRGLNIWRSLGEDLDGAAAEAANFIRGAMDRV